MKGDNNMRRQIYTRDIAAQIIELFENILEENGIIIPSPEDDEKEDDNKACLYGSVYSDLLDSVEEIIVDTTIYVQEGNEVITDEFSGNW